MERESELRRRSIPLDITCFRTSIWDETLYKASQQPMRSVWTLALRHLPLLYVPKRFAATVHSPSACSTAARPNCSKCVLSRPLYARARARARITTLAININSPNAVANKLLIPVGLVFDCGVVDSKCQHAGNATPEFCVHHGCG